MSPESIPLPILGLLFGIQHAIEPDHIVAVTAMVARERSLRRAVALGASWGLGHTLTVVALGSVLVIFRPIVPSHIGLGLEFLVALMLIGLGLRNLIALPSHGHGHPVQHPSTGDHAHGHPHHGHHAHAGAPARGPRSWPAAILVGCLHGLAGSTAIALIVLVAVREIRLALLYLAFFGLGTIVGMSLLTLLLGYPMLLAAQRSGMAHRWITMTTGGAGVLLGCWLIWRIGIIDGLFTSHPHWMPQ